MTQPIDADDRGQEALGGVLLILAAGVGAALLARWLNRDQSPSGRADEALAEALEPLTLVSSLQRTSAGLALAGRPAEAAVVEAAAEDAAHEALQSAARAAENLVIAFHGGEEVSADTAVNLAAVADSLPLTPSFRDALVALGEAVTDGTPTSLESAITVAEEAVASAEAIDEATEWLEATMRLLNAPTGTPPRLASSAAVAMADMHDRALALSVNAIMPDVIRRTAANVAEVCSSRASTLERLGAMYSQREARAAAASAQLLSTQGQTYFQEPPRAYTGEDAIGTRHGDILPDGTPHPWGFTPWPGCSYVWDGVAAKWVSLPLSDASPAGAAPLRERLTILSPLQQEWLRCVSGARTMKAGGSIWFINHAENRSWSGGADLLGLITSGQRNSPLSVNPLTY